MRRPSLLAVVMFLLCALSAGPSAAAVRDAARASFPDPAARSDSTAIDRPVRGAFSPEGRFRILWPDGCSKIRTRSYPATDPAAPDTLGRVDVFCDNAEQGAGGTMVIELFSAPGREAFTPADITEMIGSLVVRSGQTITRQGPVERFATTGVRVLAREKGGSQASWIEGFKIKGRIFVLMAWGLEDVLYKDPEISRFFASLEVLD